MIREIIIYLETYKFFLLIKNLSSLILKPYSKNFFINIIYNLFLISF